MHLISLKAKNFQSFKELEYKFHNGVPTLIVGENLTDEGQESNGSGKSVLMNVAEYCILHMTSKKVTDANLIYWWDGSEQAEVELSIYCPLRKELMLIERRISSKGGGQSQLSFNDEIKYAFADKMVNEIDRAIIDWIGISKEDLQNFFILSKFKYVSFFNASNSNIIQLIGRFSNSSIISGIDKDILSEAETLESDRILLSDQKNRFYGMIDAHKSNIETERTIDKKKLVEDKLNQIDDQVLEEGDKVIKYQEEIGIQNDKIVAINEDITRITGLLDKSNEQLKEIEVKALPFDARYKEIDGKLNEVRNSKEKQENELTLLNNNKNETLLIIQEIDRNLKGSVKCPKCQFEFVVGKEGIDVETEKEAFVSASELINTMNTSIETLKNSINSFDPTIKDLKRSRVSIEAEENELRSLKRNILNNIANIEKDKNRYSVDLSSCESRIQGYKKDIELSNNRMKALLQSKSDVTLDSFDNTTKIKSIEEEIIKCETSIVDLESKDKSLNDEIFDIKQWAFTFREFQQHLSVKTLKVLQGYANKALEELRSDLRISLSGFKMRADGTLSDKITATIIREGEEKEFNNFSGGERARLEFAMILTISRAINSTNKYGGLDFISIDEVLESGDSACIKSITDSLMGLGRTVLLTTHVPSTSYNCDTLKIVKVQNTSHIYNN